MYRDIDDKLSQYKIKLDQLKHTQVYKKLYSDYKLDKIDPNNQNYIPQLNKFCDALEQQIEKIEADDSPKYHSATVN